MDGDTPVKLVRDSEAVLDVVGSRELINVVSKEGMMTAVVVPARGGGRVDDELDALWLVDSVLVEEPTILEELLEELLADWLVDDGTRGPRLRVLDIVIEVDDKLDNEVLLKLVVETVVFAKPSSLRHFLAQPIGTRDPACGSRGSRCLRGPASVAESRRSCNMKLLVCICLGCRNTECYRKREVAPCNSVEDWVERS